MIRSVQVVVAVTVVGFLVSPVGTAQEGKKTEIEGTWALVSLERDGKEVKIQKDTRLVVRGDKFVVMVGDKVIAGGTSKIEPGNKWKAIDSMYTEGPDKGKSFKAIYQLDGDRLRFSRAGSPEQERPTGFKSTPEGGGLVSVYQRSKD